MKRAGGMENDQGAGMINKKESIDGNSLPVTERIEVFGENLSKDAGVFAAIGGAIDGTEGIVTGIALAAVVNMTKSGWKNESQATWWWIGTATGMPLLLLIYAKVAIAYYGAPWMAAWIFFSQPFTDFVIRLTEAAPRIEAAVIRCHASHMLIFHVCGIIYAHSLVNALITIVPIVFTIRKNRYLIIPKIKLMINGAVFIVVLIGAPIAALYYGYIYIVDDVFMRNTSSYNFETVLVCFSELLNCGTLLFIGFINMAMMFVSNIPLMRKRYKK